MCSSLEKHIDAVKERTLFKGTDFKLASSHQPLSDKVAKECGFTSLSVRVVDVIPRLLKSSPDLISHAVHFY